jgi:carboxymethylenebutenolidase
VGQDIKLTASDNFQLGGYRADPAGAPKAAVVVIQEIFGVNHHIRAVCDRLAGEGYVAIAPAIFDRVERNFQCSYSPDEIAVARKFVVNPDWPAMLRDTQAAVDAVKSVGAVGIIGFCLGGSIAYAAATKLSGLSAAIGYYGGAVVRFADDKPDVPTQLHFGEKRRGHSAQRRRNDQSQAARGRNLHLSRRAARLPLRRTGKLRQGQRRYRLAAQPRLPRQAFEEIGRGTSNSLTAIIPGPR